MFDLEYRGANAVVLTTKKITVVIDPKISPYGLNDVTIREAVFFATETRFQVDNDERPRLFDGPGEYEIADVSVKGIAAQRHLDSQEQGKSTTIYRMTIGDIRVVVIGNIAPKLDDNQLEEIGVVDIAIVPVGGNGYTLDGTSAAGVIRQLEPKAVVPVHYKDSGISYEVPQDELDNFVKELGAPIIEGGAKWKVKGVSSLPEQLTVIKLDRS